MPLWLERFTQNLRHGIRSLGRSPTFTIVAAVTFGLGIGANTTIFTVVNAVLLRPLPFADPGHLVMVEEKRPPRLNHFEASPLNFLSWKARSQSFRDLAAYGRAGFNLSEDDRPERVPGARVTANLFTLLGVAPILGRGFSPDEDRPGADRVVVLGFDLWQRRFAGDRGVLGRQIEAGGVSYTVVGVMPRGFHFPDVEEIWKPMAFTPKDLASPLNHFIWVVGRLKPGVTAVAAQAEMDLVYSPGANNGWSTNILPLKTRYVGNVRTPLLILFSAVSLVLLIACANIANLLLARAASRRREMAIRASLGATRRQIVSQLLTESGLLALLGGALGILMARWSLPVLLRFSPTLASFDGIAIDRTVLAFTGTVSLLAGVLFGLAAARHLASVDLRGPLTSESKGGAGSEIRRGTRSALVIAEVALALVLLIGAGLLEKSFRHLRVADPGFRQDHVLTAQLSLPPLAYAEAAAQTQFVEALLERGRSLPGVRSVAVSTSIPFRGVSDVGIHFDRPPDASVTGTIANYYAVTPDYFRALGIPLVRGRFLSPHDTPGSPPVVVINDTMARRFFADRDPIGTRLDISGPTYMREIVGVVGDVKQDGLTIEPHPQVYEAFAQKPGRSLFVLAQADAPATVLADAIRQAVSTIDKHQPLSAVLTMDEIVRGTLEAQTLSAVLFGCFAGIGLMLAILGVYGVMAYSVAQRTGEIGLRMALGQNPASILRMVLSQSLVLVAAGISIGLVASLLLARFLQTLLFEVDAIDPAIFALFAATLLMAALVAAAIPARRASRVDPIVALQSRS